MGKKFLIDTNVLLEFVGNVLSENASQFIADLLSGEFNISVINRIEVLGHPSANKLYPTSWETQMNMD